MKLNQTHFSIAMDRKLPVVICLFVAMLTNKPLYAQKGDALKWLVATWKITMSKGVMVEQWKQLNDSTYAGRSVMVKSPNDTVPRESLVLQRRKGEWAYVSTVQGQNNNQAVAFKVIFLGRTEFICENKAHDFPQRIAYRRYNNQLFASIEGSNGGKYNKRNFDYVTE